MVSLEETQWTEKNKSIRPLGGVICKGKWICHVQVKEMYIIDSFYLLIIWLNTVQDITMNSFFLKTFNFKQVVKYINSGFSSAFTELFVFKLLMIC